MVLRLDRYHANLPYPQVNRVHEDKELITYLIQPYSGENSELKTVMQYAYHSLCCKEKYREVSQMMRGIFYIETMHLELIGDVIIKLGGNPQYVLSLQHHQIAWQSSVIDYETHPEQMLLADIEGEKGSAAFYQQASEIVEQADIARLLARLALDEQLHHRMLTDLYGRLFHL